MVGRVCLAALLLLFLRAPVSSADVGSDWLNASVARLRTCLPAADATAVAKAAGAFRRTAGPRNSAPFDARYALRMFDEPRQRVSPYDLLDEAMKRESALDTAWKQIEEHTSDQKAAPLREQAADDYAFLKCRLRFLLAVARAGVAQRMASPSTRSYSLQAMESAIDALRDSANFADRMKTPSSCLGTSSPPPEKIRALRQRLLDVWDRSQREGDITLIRDLDLRALVVEAVGRSTSPGLKATLP